MDQNEFPLYWESEWNYLFWLSIGIIIGGSPVFFVFICCCLDLCIWRRSQERISLPPMPAAHVRAFETTLRHIMEWKVNHGSYPDDIYR